MANLYFGEEVTQAILDFKKEESQAKRNKIFVDKIMPAFEKMINYHYYSMPVAKNEEVLQDCMVHLYEIVEKFDEEKASGNRAFPYFNIIVRNFFRQKLRDEKKEIQNDQYPISLIDYKQQEGKLEEYPNDDLEEILENKEFIEIFKENLYEWRDHFKKEQEVKVIDALISIFENAEKLELHNKKAVFWYLRELTDLKSKQVATNLAKIKKKFALLKRKYQRGDI